MKKPLSFSDVFDSFLFAFLLASSFFCSYSLSFVLSHIISIEAVQSTLQLEIKNLQK